MPAEAQPHFVIIGGGRAEAVATVLRALPATPGFAVIVAGVDHTSISSLADGCTLQIGELGNEPIYLDGVRDRVVVIPHGRGAIVHDGALRIGPSADGAALDGVFRTFADQLGPTAIGVLLAGDGADGADGTLGLKRIRQAGGLTIAQGQPLDGETPHAAIATGVVDIVLPLDGIATRLLDDVAMRGRLHELDDAPAPTESTLDSIREILTLVRIRSGHDFHSYRRATLYRRIGRRMQVRACATIGDYQRYLRDHPGELASLLRDLLISVTSFFRDREVFETLERDIVPELFAGKSTGEQVRAWVAGCATGEEAYSIAILLLEHAARLPSPPQLQVFATDIDEVALAEARTGVYPDAIAADVSGERLDRFFSHDDRGFRVTKELRDVVLFSPQNVLRDPPFSRLDLISCRNLLIYLNRDAQNRLLTTFHFGLRDRGYLLLGSSESAESSAIFDGVDGGHARLFVRRPTRASIGDAIATTGRWHPPAPPPSAAPSERIAAIGDLHHRIVEHYAPPSVLVNADLDVVHVSEHAGRYLEVRGGEPTRQLLRLVTPALRVDLHTAIYAARQHGTAARVVQFGGDGAGPVRVVELRVRALDVPELGHGAVLALFDELDTNTLGRSPGEPRPSPAAGDPAGRELEDELQRTRDQLRATVEQYETSVEELKASNEELQAINEELRSATEELETSKEELQSVNEELTSLNHELKIKVDELSHANSDLQNLMTSTEIGVMFLDRGLRIKRFTPRAAELFNVIRTDLGRPLAHITHRLDISDLGEIAQSVLTTLHSVKREVVADDGRSYLARWLPYRSLEDRIDGVVLTFVDVTDLRDAVAAHRRSEHALVVVEERLRSALRSAPLVVLGFDHTGRPDWMYMMGREIATDAIEALAELAPGAGERLRALARDVLTRRIGQRAELEVIVDGTPRTFDFRVEPGTTGVTAVGFDITPSKQAAETLREVDRRKDEFLATLSHELRNPLMPLQVALDVIRLVDHDPVKRDESLTIMARQVAMLTALVDELLDLSRITQGKIAIDRAPVELAGILEAALETTRPSFQPHHTLDVELPDARLRVHGDARRLVQVFANLLTNAAKYTPPGGHVTLSVAADRTAGSVVVRVADDGVGIPAEMLPWIFDIFVQVRDHQGRARGGLGVGLNIVRRLVELHGGTASAHSDGVGRGSTFTIELPLVRE